MYRRFSQSLSDTEYDRPAAGTTSNKIYLHQKRYFLIKSGMRQPAEIYFNQTENVKEVFLLTVEEKIAHLKTTSMEQARAEGNAIIDSHREALEKVLEDHKAEALRQSETRIKAETTNAKLSLNQASAKSQLEIKRRQGKVQQELKDKVFKEALELVKDYMKTEAYDDFLVKCIRNAERFAGDEALIVYINPSDEKRRPDLEDATGIHLTISAEDFIGGIRAVIRSRNILIDNSFRTQLRNEYDKFIFLGGDGNVSA